LQEKSLLRKKTVKKKEQQAYSNALDTLDRTLTETGHEKCGKCAAMSFGPFLDGDTPELIVATNAVQSHAESGEFVNIEDCEDGESCVLHEEISFPLARRILKLRDARMENRYMEGQKEKSGMFYLECRGNDHPAGFMGEDAGYILIVFSKKKAIIHVCVNVEDEDEENQEAWEGIRYPGTFSEAWDRHFENCKEWCLEKYQEIRALAGKNLFNEPPKAWEKGSPIKGPRRKA
jgi:hypothetical protein